MSVTGPVDLPGVVWVTRTAAGIRRSLSLHPQFRARLKFLRGLVLVSGGDYWRNNCLSSKLGAVVGGFRGLAGEFRPGAVGWCWLVAWLRSSSGPFGGREIWRQVGHAANGVAEKPPQLQVPDEHSTGSARHSDKVDFISLWANAAAFCAIYRRPLLPLRHLYLKRIGEPNRDASSSLPRQ